MSETLPELSQGYLDAAALERLFAELASAASVREVRIKGGATRMAERGLVPLSEALERLRAGELRGVQVLYSFEGSSWCDTILAQEGAWRVCRMQI